MRQQIPLVSVVTVVLNGAQHIEETILSVVAAKDSSIEYIVIDGGSTDGTLDIVKKYSRYIDYHISEPDGGIFDAMNKGIRIAKGHCVGLLNCGDYYLTDTIKVVIKQLRDCKEPYFLIAGGVNMVDDSKCVVSGYIPDEYRIQRRFFSMPLCHPALFVSRTIYIDFGLYNVSFKIASDYEFVLRILERNIPVYILQRILTNMSTGGISDTWRSLYRRVKEYYIILRKYKGLGYCLLVSAREIAAYVVRPLRRKIQVAQSSEHR